MKSLFPDNWNKSREVEVHTRLVAQKSCGLNLLFLIITVPESSSSSQGISLKRWAVLAENDAASDSRYGTICLFQALASLLYFEKNIKSEVWHFQFPLTQIYYLHKTLLPFKQSFCFIDSLRILFTLICDYIVTHANVWAAYHILQFIYYLFKSCLPLAS